MVFYYFFFPNLLTVWALYFATLYNGGSSANVLPCESSPPHSVLLPFWNDYFSCCQSR